MIEKRRIVTNAASSIAQIVVSGATLAMLYRYLLETLGVAQLGIWSLVLAMSSMIQVANFGFTGSIVKNIADYDAKGDKHTVVIAIQTAIITVAGLSLVLIGCAYPAAKYYLSFAVEGQAYHDALNVLPLALVAFWILMITSIYQSGMYGCQLIAQRNGVLIAEGISHLTLCIFLAPRYGLLGLAYARVAQNILTLVASIVFLKNHLPLLPVFPCRWSRTLLREMAGYATSFQVISFLVMLADPITKALLSRFGSVSLVGYYEMGSKLVQLFRSLIVNANQVLVPAFANLKQLNPQKVSELYLASSHIVIYLAVPSFGLLAICAPLVSELWIGHNEPAFVWSMVMLCAGWLVNTLSAPAYFASLGTGEMRINVMSHVVMTIANIVLALSLGQVIGGLGVVAGWAIALGIGGLWLNICYCNQKSIAFGNLISRDDRTLGLYVVFGLGASHLTWQVLPKSWGTLLPALGMPAAWGPILTSAVTILGYLAILALQIWKHSIRSDLQRWLVSAFAKEPTLQGHIR
ncbi:lipopolysaccharide biosynthesis protein [Nitrospira sp. BLG_1]|uniref:lipopolysaccharide biosynthesis protein n=1 Tax=Nitrospira sp. BLG_1 TaxID=3395883 RepID=UPI0039BCBF0D